MKRLAVSLSGTGKNACEGAGLERVGRWCEEGRDPELRIASCSVCSYFSFNKHLQSTYFYQALFYRSAFHKSTFLMGKLSKWSFLPETKQKTAVTRSDFSHKYFYLLSRLCCSDSLLR